MELELKPAQKDDTLAETGSKNLPKVNRVFEVKYVSQIRGQRLEGGVQNPETRDGFGALW